MDGCLIRLLPPKPIKRSFKREDLRLGEQLLEDHSRCISFVFRNKESRLLVGYAPVHLRAEQGEDLCVASIVSLVRGVPVEERINPSLRGFVLSAMAVKVDYQ